MYNPFIKGKYVYLRHPTEEDSTGKWHEWFSDEEITKYLADRFWPNSKEKQLYYLKNITNDKRHLVLSVVTITGDIHIGVASLSKINWVHRYTDIAIVIGNKEYQKEPYSIEGFSLLLKIAFLKFNLLNVKSAHAKSNQGSEALHRLFRFKKIGVYRKLLNIDGKSDDLILEILDHETWKRKNLLNYNKIES